mgnify:CR=1 FL=1
MHKNINQIKRSPGDNIFNIIVNIFLFLALLVVAIPMMNILSSSLSSSEAVISGKVFIWPVDFSLDGYRAVIHEKSIFTGFYNTVIITVFGTIINIIMTLIAAYPLSRKDLPGKGMFMFMFTFTMMFSGGLIPSYLLNKSLGLINNRLVMMIPGAIGVYNMTVVITYFKTSIPGELLEAAHIDGCSDFKYFYKIAVPLAKPVIAVITLYYAVGHWNTYFDAMIYLNEKSKYPLSIVLRDILVSSKFSAEVTSYETMKATGQSSEEVLKYSLIILSSLPVWCAYPFAQKYFVEGVMLGSIKG